MSHSSILLCEAAFNGSFAHKILIFSFPVRATTHVAPNYHYFIFLPLVIFGGEFDDEEGDDVMNGHWFRQGDDSGYQRGKRGH